jgi:hypothetical protein
VSRSANDIAGAGDLGGDVVVAGDIGGLHYRIAAFGFDLLDQGRQGSSKTRIGLDRFLQLHLQRTFAASALAYGSLLHLL